MLDALQAIGAFAILAIGAGYLYWKIRHDGNEK